MKYTLPLLLLIAFTSCKKKNDNQPDTTTKVTITSDYKLQKVYTDDTVLLKFSYNSDNVVSQVNQWVAYRGFHYSGPLEYAIIYRFMRYDNLLRVFCTTSTPTEKTWQAYVYNANSRKPLSMQNSLGQPTQKYDYDASNRVNKISYYDGTGKLVQQDDLSYNNKGNVTQIERQFFYDTASYYGTLSSITKYTGYDNAHTIYAALPGITEIAQTPGGVQGLNMIEALSNNNPLGVEQTLYNKGGIVQYSSSTFKYEYNKDNYPVKRTTTTDTSTYSIYYMYDK